VTDSVAIDFDAWDHHARWWESEADRLREQYAVDDATLARAGTMFGMIGAEVGAGLQDVLRARAAAGERLGAYCEGVAAHIRAELQSYATNDK